MPIPASGHVHRRHQLPAALANRLKRTLHIEETVGGQVESSCVGCLNLLCIPVRRLTSFNGCR